MKAMDLQQKIQDATDPDFVWEEYLEESKSVSALPEAFIHVEHSLESVFKVGMQLEIPNPDFKDSYWLASVVMTCGELLSLRYAGFGEDRSSDFWFDIKSAEFHCAGWCKANSKKLFPPKVVLERHPDLNSFLESELKKIQSVPALVSEDHLTASMPIEQIKCGMKVEIAHELDPRNVWIATILQNIGGRLLLRYDGLNDDFAHDFWMFYLCDRLCDVGYAAVNNMKYSVPSVVKHKHSANQWNDILKKSLNYSEQPFPTHVLEPKTPLEEHEFKEGMKLEAVNPQNYCDICPATVTRVINSFYFLVTIDSYGMDESITSILCCNSNQQLIFPINWAEENGLDLKIPKGYGVKDSKFVWDDYLHFCNAVAAPNEMFPMCCMNTGFQNDMKLEAVDPLHPNNIFAATIENIAEPIMFLTFDSEETPKRKIITGINSFDIYPVGWCASNVYPLRTPVYRSKHKNIVVHSPIEHTEKPMTTETKVSSQTEQQGKSWCPKIYFNHRCFTGPLLSKSRLAELPKAIGPGPVHLVMNEVISRVVNIAYKSSRVLQLLQVHGKPSPGMQQQIVKAKYKGKSYRATIDVIQHSGQVEDYCKTICTKLECCPYLFGPKLFEEVCPGNCYTQTKTKFGYNFVKKHKKPGRPPLASTSAASDSTSETVRRGPGRKKKRKHWTQLLAQSENSQKENISKPDESSAAEEDTVKSENESHVNETVSERAAPQPKVHYVKKKLKHIPTSNIVTRGAKLPNFGLWHHVTSFHSRRGRPRTRPIRAFPPRKVGRPLGSTKKAIAIQKISEDDDTISSTFKEEETKPPPKVPFLKSNPKDWSIEEVEKFIQESDCAPVAPLLKEQEIDGQALLMLDLFSVQQFLNLRPEPAKKLCLLLQRVKIDFFTYFSCNN